MPRAPRRCAKAGCNNIQPCALPRHQRGWKNVNPDTALPSNWDSIVRLVKKRDATKGCALCGKMLHLEVDHIIERSDGGTNDISNLRLLCKKCHDQKTYEARRIRRKKRGGIL